MQDPGRSWRAQRRMAKERGLSGVRPRRSAQHIAWHSVRVELGWLGCRVTYSLIHIIYIKLLLRMRCRAVCASFLARDGEMGKGSES